MQQNIGKKKIVWMINVVVFVVLLCSGGLLSLFLPAIKVSESEKRVLTPMPRFSWQNVFIGEYTDSLDLHYADNFPFRDPLVDFTSAIKETFGYRAHDLRIYNNVPEANAVEEKTDSVAVVKADTVVEKTLETGKNTRDLANSIVIHNGMAFQIFGGSEERVKAFAQMINQYHEKLGDSINVFCLVAPSAIDFYLPIELKSARSFEKPNIEKTYSYLDSGVFAVDAYGEIEQHTDEYLYFNTDHHWTGRGAYYAYRAFCSKAGFTPVELSSLNRRVRKGYLGSLYDITKDVRLKAHKDSVEIFRLPIQTECLRYRTSDLANPEPSPLFAGTKNYATFLGGDFPLTRIQTGLANGRKVLVIKDSYGNAMCPFLAMHFEEVLVVDYRHFERNILNFIRNNGVTDVIFLHNTFVTNTEYTVKKEKYMMRIKDPDLPVEIENQEKEKVVTEIKSESTVDSTKNN